jgi:hypothetical protein
MPRRDGVRRADEAIRNHYPSRLRGRGGGWFHQVERWWMVWACPEHLDRLTVLRTFRVALSLIPHSTSGEREGRAGERGQRPGTRAGRGARARDGAKREQGPTEPASQPARRARASEHERRATTTRAGATGDGGPLAMARTGDASKREISMTAIPEPVVGGALG